MGLQAGVTGEDRASRPRVVIGDKHEAARRGIRLALEEDGFVVSAEVSTGPDAIAAALRDPPELCILEVELPGGGIDAAGSITSQLPQTRVVMLAGSGTSADVFAALQAGAAGYLLKGMSPSRLGPALRDVLRGNAALPRSLTALLIDEFRSRARLGHVGLVRPCENDLTSREWEVLDCLREGLSTAGIADRLFISDTTVRRHVGSILRKLDAPSREAALEVVAQRSRNLSGE